MLPVPTARELEVLEARNKRRQAARRAFDSLARKAQDDSRLRLAIGTLPRLWHGLAVEERLGQHLAEAEAGLHNLPATLPDYERARAALRCEGLRHFNQSFRVALDGVR